MVINGTHHYARVGGGVAMAHIELVLEKPLAQAGNVHGGSHQEGH